MLAGDKGFRIHKNSCPFGALFWARVGMEGHEQYKISKMYIRLNGERSSLETSREVRQSIRITLGVVLKTQLADAHLQFLIP